MALLPARFNIWELAVLAFLRERPMHPYEMQRLLRERHKDELLALKRGSLYHAINRLLKLALIEPLKTARMGRRPERTTYRITPPGRQALMEWLQNIVSVPVREPSEFMAAMSFLVHLTPQQAITRLEERMQRLETEVASLQTGMAAVSAWVERINLIESEYLVAMRQAEVVWIRRLVNELRSGRFSWDFKSVVRDAKTRDSVAGKARKRS